MINDIESTIKTPLNLPYAPLRQGGSPVEIQEITAMLTIVANPPIKTNASTSKTLGFKVKFKAQFTSCHKKWKSRSRHAGIIIKFAKNLECQALHP